MAVLVPLFNLTHYWADLPFASRSPSRLSELVIFRYSDSAAR